MKFADLLATLPAVDHLNAIELLEGDLVVARIENKPGQAGSLKVYHALYQEFGAINDRAAEKGLRIYAEHTADALSNPGKHPNIDRLVKLAQSGLPLAVRLIGN